MKRFLLLLATAAIASSQGATPPEQSQRYAFVGTFVSMKPVDCPSDNDPGLPPGEYNHEDLVSRCTETPYSMTYRVEQVLEGPLKVGQRIQFYSVDDQYGSSPYSDARTALVYARKINGRIYSMALWSDAVYKTRSGGFASCGCGLAYDPDETYSPDSLAPKECVTITFVPEVSEDLTHRSSAYIAALRKRGAHRVLEHKAICERGVAISDIYRLYRKVVFPGVAVAPTNSSPQRP